MVWKNVYLPLYEDEDYTYTVALEQDAYNLRIYYNRRMSSWFMDITSDGGTELVMSVALHIFYPITRENYIPGLTGFFWLQPIGQDDNQTPLHPDMLSKYYELFYVWQEEE